MKKCRFYDDGVGNGSYIPGSCCGPPSCSLGGNDKCNGIIIHCNIKEKRTKKLEQIANKIKNE